MEDKGALKIRTGEKMERERERESNEHRAREKGCGLSERGAPAEHDVKLSFSSTLFCNDRSESVE